MEVKTMTKKTTTAKEAEIKSETEIKSEIFIEFEGKQVDEQAVIQKVKEDCMEKEITVTELTLYFKPEDNACYYVANSEVSGKVALF